MVISGNSWIIDLAPGRKVKCIPVSSEGDKGTSIGCLRLYFSQRLLKVEAEMDA